MHSLTLGRLQAAHSNLEDDDGMKELITRVYEKPGTDMGDFWISFMEMSDPLVQNIDACHARNVSEYMSSTYNMLPGLMAYDRHPQSPDPSPDPDRTTTVSGF